MDINVDVCVATSDLAHDGAVQRFRRYAPGLRQRGIRLRGLTYRRGEIIVFDPFDAPPTGLSFQKGSSFWVEPALLYRLMARGWSGLDTPHVLQFFSASHWNTPFLSAVRRLGIPCLHVATLSGSTRGSRLRKRLRTAYRSWLFQPFDRIVVSSEVIRSELKATGIRASRIDTIPNGVDLQRFRPAKSRDESREIRRHLGIGFGDEVVIFVGGILPRKGVDILLEAWRLVARQRPRAHLLLLGHRHEDQAKFHSFRDRLNQLVNDSPVPERITFTGMVGDVERYLRVADVFVFPSHREGMGNAVLEAMATGLPCVLTRFQGFPEDFGTAGREYVLARRTPTDLAAAMLDLLDRNDKCHAMGKRARSWSETHLDVGISLDRYACLYRELAVHKPASPTSH